MIQRRSFLFALGCSAVGALAYRRGSTSMAQTQPIKQVAARFYQRVNDAMETGNFALMDDVVARNAVDHNPTPGQVPGREGIKKAFGEFREAFPDMRMTVEDMVAEGDKVACRFVIRMTHRGQFQEIPPTGKQITVSGIDILKFANGALTDRWGEFDSLGFMQQLGRK